MDGRDWPISCAACEGQGVVPFRTCALARALNVDRRQLWRVSTLRAGPVVAMHVLEAITRRFPGALKEV